jgi:hypothetical protein
VVRILSWLRSYGRYVILLLMFSFSNRFQIQRNNGCYRCGVLGRSTVVRQGVKQGVLTHQKLRNDMFTCDSRSSFNLNPYSTWLKFEKGLFALLGAGHKYCFRVVARRDVRHSNTQRDWSRQCRQPTRSSTYSESPPCLFFPSVLIRSSPVSTLNLNPLSGVPYLPCAVLAISQLVSTTPIHILFPLVFPLNRKQSPAYG